MFLKFIKYIYIYDDFMLANETAGVFKEDTCILQNSSYMH